MRKIIRWNREKPSSLRLNLSRIFWPIPRVAGTNSRGTTMSPEQASGNASEEQERSGSASPSPEMVGSVKETSVVDLESARLFLSLLDPDGIFTFQTFPYGEIGGLGALARVFHGSLDQYAPVLTKMNAAGAGIFVMV